MYEEDDSWPRTQGQRVVGLGQLAPKRSSCYSVPASCCFTGILSWLRFEILVKVFQLSVQADSHPLELSRSWRPGLRAENSVGD